MPDRTKPHDTVGVLGCTVPSPPPTGMSTTVDELRVSREEPAVRLRLDGPAHHHETKARASQRAPTPE
jgi:hypothetical protein